MKNPRKRLPQTLLQLLNAADASMANGISLLPEVERVVRAVNEAVEADDKRAAINRRFSHLNSSNPQLFSSVVDWLKLPETENLFRSFGGYFAISQLSEGFQAIANGDMPHAAMKMNQNGAPPLWGFTKVESAALYAKNLEVNHQLNEKEARAVASIEFDIPTSEIRDCKLSIQDKGDLALFAYQYEMQN